MRQRYRPTGPDAATVEAVLERDGRACARCGVPVRGDRGVDWSVQHRLPRSGGGSNLPSNLVILCGSGTTLCHGHVESRRAEALELGYLVSRYSDPARVAVEIRGRRFVYLGDDGAYHDNPPERAS